MEQEHNVDFYQLSAAMLVRVLKSTRVILLILICFVWWCSAFCFLPNKQTSLSLNVRRRALNVIPTVTNYFVFKNGVGPCVWMGRLVVRKQWKKTRENEKNKFIAILPCVYFWTQHLGQFLYICHSNHLLVVAHWAHFLGGSQMHTDVLLIENSYRLMWNKTPLSPAQPAYPPPPNPDQCLVSHDISLMLDKNH